MNPEFEVHLIGEDLHIQILNQNSLKEGKINFYLLNEKYYLKDISTIILNFQHINELNSSGISELVSIYNNFKKRNPTIKFKLIEVSEKIKNILNLVNLDDYVEIIYKSNSD